MAVAGPSGGPRLVPTRRTWLGWLVAAGLGGLSGSAATWALGPHLRAPALGSLPPAVRVYEAVSPSVVLVTAQAVRPTPFGPEAVTGFGSGVVVDPRGYVVTNEHVLAGASRVVVTLPDGRSYAAEVVGADPSTDLAVLRVRAGGRLPVARFAHGPVRPGETAIAIGNPLGRELAQSVTVGVVSAIRPMLYGLGGAAPRVTRMIQTDVAINPGNSGGPLLNAQGEVIGITTIKVPLVGPGVAAAGLGFAIPADTVERVVGDILRYGYVRRAWLGVRLQLQPPEALPAEPQRVAVAAVVPDSPAARAGLAPGDEILAWDGHAIRNAYDLVVRIDRARPGARIALAVRRGQRVVTLWPVLGLAPGHGAGA